MPAGTIRVGGRSARVRASVLHAALDILQRQGFAALTVDSVAQQAGVHRTTLHRRWPSRAALVAEALIEHSAVQVPVPDAGSLEADLRAFARAVRDAISSRTGRGIASALADPAVAEELSDVDHRFWEARFRATRVIVERAVKRREVPSSTDARFVIELVAGPIWFRTFVVGDRANDELIDRIVDAALGGLSK